MIAKLVIKGINGLCNWMDYKKPIEEKLLSEQSIPHKGNYFTYEQQKEWERRVFQNEKR